VPATLPGLSRLSGIPVERHSSTWVKKKSRPLKLRVHRRPPLFPPWRSPAHPADAPLPVELSPAHTKILLLLWREAQHQRVDVHRPGTASSIQGAAPSLNVFADPFWPHPSSHQCLRDGHVVLQNIVECRRDRKSSRIGVRGSQTVWQTRGNSHPSRVFPLLIFTDH